MFICPKKSHSKRSRDAHFNTPRGRYDIVRKPSWSDRSGYSATCQFCNPPCLHQKLGSGEIWSSIWTEPRLALGWFTGRNKLCCDAGCGTCRTFSAAGPADDYLLMYELYYGPRRETTVLNHPGIMPRKHQSRPRPSATWLAAPCKGRNTLGAVRLAYLIEPMLPLCTVHTWWFTLVIHTKKIKTWSIFLVYLVFLPKRTGFAGCQIYTHIRKRKRRMPGVYRHFSLASCTWAKSVPASRSRSRVAQVQNTNLSNFHSYQHRTETSTKCPAANCSMFLPWGFTVLQLNWVK